MYSVAAAPWQFGFAVLPAFLLLAGTGLIVYAFGYGRTKPRQLHPVIAALMGIVFASGGMFAAFEHVSNTNRCLSATPDNGASYFEGKIEGAVARGKFGSQYYEIAIGGQSFVSAGRGARSECGFKQSYAQAMYPQPGTVVRGLAVGSTILQITHLP